MTNSEKSENVTSYLYELELDPCQKHGKNSALAKQK